MSHQYHDRISLLERRVEEARESLDPDPPDDEQALALLRQGFGPTVSLYCEARTGDTMAHFDEIDFDRLETTMNDWLALYTACYGVDLDGEYTIRAAAELLIDTRDAQDVAQLLTGVPER